jgi:Flp pilus assembly CpaF family ATPase
MNYSELTTALANSIDNLSDSDLRSLNSFLVEEINSRIQQKRRAVRAALNIGDRVTVNDPRCKGKTFVIEKFSAKMATLRQEVSEDIKSANGFMIAAPRLRASIGLLQSA